MGLKYIEVIKTLTLVVLIGLSLVFTFLIMNAAPYDTIGRQATVDISIAESPERKDIDTLVKPYKMNFNFKEGLTGTTDDKQIEYMLNVLKKWRITNPELVHGSFSEEKLHEFMHRTNQLVFYYPDEIPLSVYETVLNIENPNIPETSFNIIIAEWNLTNSMLEIHFISQLNNLHYKSAVKIFDLQSFLREVVNVGRSYDEYVEIAVTDQKKIRVSAGEVSLYKKTFFPNERDEINPTRFRSALFSDPNAVRISTPSKYREDFQDNHALMSVDTRKKQLQFVHPLVESREIAIPSELLEDTIDFVNEHGGWTDEYRFSKMNFRTRYVSFKLYVSGIPVLGGNTATEIEQVWGEDAVYQYKRPYYMLGETLPSETEMVVLPPGVDVAEALMASPKVDFHTIKEIIPAYYMKHDVDLNIFVLEPSWFYLQNDKWVRFSPDQLGGEWIGLE